MAEQNARTVIVYLDKAELLTTAPGDAEASRQPSISTSANLGFRASPERPGLEMVDSNFSRLCVSRCSEKIPSRPVRTASRRILERHNNALAKYHERGLNLFGFGIVLRVQHTPHNGFAHAEAPRKFGVGHVPFAHGKV
jgi:hypothetical protein